ncbi:RES domain-containing protein [Pectobacterium carotovorum]|uniref:RES domain-containing protein n=1 Tax=Pectobacterium carotovorum TaxID=554 RepID=UPI0029D76ADA|nr:RES domain-containing protein [Pectobacterium carotovorum]MDX6917791.1 RES domain-containing protein [Pectobacterium carotovorum]
MGTLFGGNLHEKIKSLVAAEDASELQVTEVIEQDTVYYKLQAESFGGNGVYFNPDSNNRFSLSDNSKSPMYMANSPHTSCHEFYQEEKFIDQSDFTTNCMAEIRVERPLRVFDERLLAPLLGVAVGDLMGPKTVYADTQQLAKELSQHADGLTYLSRHTGFPCVVLWSEDVTGAGMVSTDSVTPLSEYTHNGKTGKEILKSQLGILVV